MLDRFNEFLKYKENNKEKGFIDRLNCILSKFSFRFLEKKENFSNQVMINNLKKTKIITIDECDVSDNNYLIICFNETLIVFQREKFSLLKKQILAPQFDIYTIQQKTKDYISTQIGMNINITTIDGDNEEYIKIFSQFFNRKYPSFFDLVKKSIFLYLIKKGFLNNSQNNRIQNSKEFFNPDSDNFELTKNDYIVLNSLHLTHIKLIYHIEKEMIYVLKYFLDDKLFQREKNNLKSINHPFILKCHGTGLFEGHKCLIIDYVNGETLYDMKDKSSLNKNEIIKIIFEIMIVLQFIHYKNHIYRDLKPNNIMFDKNGTIVLIDFDLMIGENDETHTKDFNQFFAAPEMAKGQYFKSSDIYSLGKVIEYIKNNYGCNDKFDERELSLLNNICSKCTKQNQNDRTKNIDELIQYFYTNFYMKINEILPKYSVLQSIKNKSIHKYFKYLIFFAEFNNQYSQLKLTKLYKKGKYIMKDREKAIYYYSLPINQSNPEYLFELGFFYLTIKKNYQKAYEYLKKSADLNYLDALYNLGMFLCDIQSPYYNAYNGIYYLNLAANKNHALAQHNLGFIFLEDQIIKRDIQKAIYYLTLSANQYFCESQYLLGSIYHQYIKDNEKAFYYFNLAAEQNHFIAQYNLGVFYNEGIFIRKDITKAIKYFHLSSNQGYMYAQFNLGFIYINGNGVPINISKGIYYLELAAKQYHPDAIYQLGLTYKNENNIEQAIKYLTYSAKQNNVNAQYHLGKIYFDKKDIQNAFIYYKLAADNGNSDAQYMLGIIFYKFKKDLNSALYYLILSAEQNNDLAQNEIIIIYNENQNINISKEKIISYLKSSAQKNNPSAQTNLGIYLLNGILIEKDVKKGIEYLTKAASQNYAYAQYLLGIVYFNRQYLKYIDINKSIRYLKLAEKQNYVEAMYYLGLIYTKSNYIVKDIDAGIYYLKKAADEFNDRNSQYALFSVYIVEKPNMTEALKYLKAAAGQNLPAAINDMALFNLNGDHVEQNPTKAFELLSSINNLYPETFYNLFAIYYYGNGVQKNINMAIYYLKKAANLKYLNAQYSLAMIYYYGKDVKQDIDKAINLFTSAANNNHVRSALMLGIHYHKSKKIQDAIHFYKIASSFNDSYAKNNLGVIFKEKKDIANAKIYFEESIKFNNNFIVTKFNLANILLDINDEKNNDEIMNLLIESSLKDFKPSQILLCYLITKKYNNIDLLLIQNELEKFTKNNKILASKLLALKYNKFLKREYFHLRKLSFLIFEEGSIPTDKFNSNCYFKPQSSSKNLLKQDITSDFYEGFGEI